MASSATYAGLQAALGYYLNKRDKARALDEEAKREEEKQRKEDERWKRRFDMQQEATQSNTRLSDELMTKRAEAERAAQIISQSTDPVSGKVRYKTRGGQEFTDVDPSVSYKTSLDTLNRERQDRQDARAERMTNQQIAESQARTAAMGQPEQDRPKSETDYQTDYMKLLEMIMKEAEPDRDTGVINDTAAMRSLAIRRAMGDQNRPWKDKYDFARQVYSGAWDDRLRGN